MHIEYYHEFIVLAQELNFHAAAEKLHVSQSALSKHIAELERHHSAQLLERDRASVRLTAKGVAFLEQAVELDNLHEALVHLFEDGSEGGGPLYISGVIESPIDFPIVSRTGEHLREAGFGQLPTILPCESVAFADQTELLRKGQAHCALILTPQSLLTQIEEEGEFEARKVYPIPMDAVVRRNHSLANRKSLTLEDLSGQTVIHLVGARFSTAWASLKEQLEQAAIPINPRLLAVAAAYDYITADPEDAILPVQRAPRFATPMQNGNAVRVPIDDERFTLQLTAIFPIGTANQQLDAFLDSLQKTYEEAFG